MLTIHELLGLPPFAEAKLEHPAQGEQVVEWVKLATAVPDPATLPPMGLLILPHAYAPPDTVQALLMAGVSVVVEQPFAPLPHEASTPAPLVRVPAGTLFTAATAALELLTQRQQALLHRANEVYEQLTDVALRGGGLQALAERLSALIHRSVMIEDATFRVLAAAVDEGEIDESRRETFSHGRTAPQVAQALLDAGIYRQLLHTMAPVHVPPLPHLGMTLPRVVVPIMVNQEMYGYIWTIAGAPVQRELEALASRHGATIAALIMFRERALQEAEVALRGDFFEQLLNGFTDKRTFHELARRLNFNLERPHQIVLVAGQSYAGGSIHSLLRDVNAWLRQRGLDGLTAWRNECVVLVLEHKAGHGRTLAEQLLRHLSHPARPLLVGVGHAVPHAAEVPESYAQAWEAILVARAQGQREGVQIFEELGLLHWLYHLPQERLQGNYFLRQILALAAYDQAREADLVETLAGYLDHGGSLVETAEALHIHRNTLIHRLKRIEELTGVDVHQPWQRLNLHVAVKAYRLQGK